MTRAPGRTPAAFLSAAGLAIASLPADGDAQERGDSAAHRCDSAEIAAVADRVAAAFDTHPFVFLGSTHGGVKRHDFLLCLLSRPAALDAATDVVVEFVSGAPQELLDRYLIGLEEVPAASLRLLALDTDRPELFATLPQVPEFLRAMRELNESLVDLDPKERELVSAFGDPDRPFFLLDDVLPAVDDLPDDLVPIVADSRAPDPRGLPEKIDALVYPGPHPDRSLEGTLEISDAEREELARRRSVRTRETMEIGFGGRDRWFERHPLDLPPDPRRGPSGGVQASLPPAGKPVKARWISRSPAR